MPASKFPPMKSQLYSAAARSLKSQLYSAAARSLKSQLYSTAARSFFHSEPSDKESGGNEKKRGLLCTLLLWLTVAIVVLLLLAAVFVAILFLIYHPRLPAFYVSSLSVVDLSVSAVSASVNSRLDITITARNPNSRLRYEYNSPLRVSVAVGGVDVADEEVPGFIHRRKSTMVLRASAGSGGQRQVTGEEVNAVEAAVSGGVAAAEVRVDGMVRALFGKLRSPLMVLRVRCQGVRVSVPGSRNSVVAAATADIGSGKCKVALKGRFWKWTV